MNPLIQAVVEGATLDRESASLAFDAIMSGQIPEDDLALFLNAQAERGPSVDELCGAARAMRAHMTSIEAPPDAIDLCGTGGDGSGTLNISTAVSFVVAGSGVPVAKHGNRSATSRSGAADVLEALGLRIDHGPEEAQAHLERSGLCFLFAPAYHPAMRYVAAVRKRLGRRTIFNLLGPISNPAGVRRQLIGVYAKDWTVPIAEVLSALGSEAAWVVHGSDGLDEISTTGPSDVAILQAGAVTLRGVVPEDVSVARTTLDRLKGGDAAHNASAIRRLLDGESGAFRDIVLLNAAAALVVAGKAGDLPAGAALAAQSIDSGQARAVLAKLGA